MKINKTRIADFIWGVGLGVLQAPRNFQQLNAEQLPNGARPINREILIEVRASEAKMIGVIRQKLTRLLLCNGVMVNAYAILPMKRRTRRRLYHVVRLYQVT